MIKHVKGNLFNAPKGSILVHSCNARGIWGAGVASQFLDWFPTAYLDYVKHCNITPKDQIMGSYRFFDAGDYSILSIITSRGVGRHKDSPEVILRNTGLALERFFRENRLNPETQIHSPKINAGLFDVPWEDTEATLSDLLTKYKFDWYVWSFE